MASVAPMLAAGTGPAGPELGELADEANRLNETCRIYVNVLIRENRWLAQRYGCGGELVDFGKGTRVPYRDLLEEMIALVTNGKGAMAAYKNVLTKAEIEAVVEHVRTLQAAE